MELKEHRETSIMSTIINGSGITTPQLDGIVVNQNGVNVADDSEFVSSSTSYSQVDAFLAELPVLV